MRNKHIYHHNNSASYAMVFLSLLMMVVIVSGCGRQDETADEYVVPAESADPVGPVIEAGQPGARLVDEEEVGLPVYPSLEVVSRVESGAMGDEVENLPAIVAVTGDSMDQVVDFYAEQLPDWYRGEFHGAEYFWPPDTGEEFDPLSMEAMNRPSISVSPPIDEGHPVRVQFIYR